MVEESPYIDINGVSFGYNPAENVLKNFSAGFPRGSTTLIAGANGAGKTTLLKMIVGLLAPQTGTITVAGKNPSSIPLHEMAHHVAVSLQTAEHHIFCATVRKEISYGPANLGIAESETTVSRIIQGFGLSKYSDDHPYDLHPAQRKLVSLASAIAMDTPFIIFDEPTAGLSRPEREIFSNVLGALREQHRGYLIISHDIAFGFQHCRQLIILHKGRCIANESLPTFLLRSNAQGIFKKADVQFPASSRMGKLFNQTRVVVTPNDFVTQFKDSGHGH